MTIQQMMCFMAAVNEKSFSQAAQGLFISQPTFGRQIASMEQELGFPLFTRTSKGNILTPGGAVLAKQLPDVLEAYHNAVAAAEAAQREPQSRLTICLMEAQLLDSELKRLLEAFRLACPDIQLTITRCSFRGIRMGLRDRSLDIGITLRPDVENRTGFDCRFLFSVANELILPADHPLVDVPNVELSDFSDDTFINIDPAESEPVSALLLKTCREAGFEPEIIFAPDLSTQVQLVEEGVGLTAFNRYHITYNHPSLTHISLPDFPPVDFCAVWLKEITNPAVKRFMEFLSVQYHGKA